MSSNGPVPEEISAYIERGRAAVRIEGAEPVYVAKGPDAFLILHGWCATAESVRFLTAGASEAGFSVLAPTLPGHGTSGEDMRQFGPLDWVRAAAEALEMLSRHHGKVFVIGTSMGGALGLQLAALNPERVAGLMTVNGAIFLNDPSFAMAVLSGSPSDTLPGWESTAYMGPPVPEITYAARSCKSGADLLAMCALARDALPRVSAPLLVMHSVNDQFVPPACAEEIVERVGSQTKELAWLTRSLHAAHLDLDRERIVALVTGMAARLAGVRQDGPTV
jgi:carboxylesterase